MFHSPSHHPHHFQVILEVAFTADDGDPLAAYLADKEANDTTLYSFAPDEQDRMLDLIGLGSGAEPDRSLHGTIVRGHFERHPRSDVQTNVTATVEHVIYAHEFAFNAQPLEDLEYILFGQGENLFLAHRIIMPPSFDQVFPVQIEGTSFSDDALREGIIVAIPERSDTIADRLQDGEQVGGEAWQAASGETIATNFTITAGSEIFFEEGELRFPGELMPSTEAEIAAGFGD